MPVSDVTSDIVSDYVRLLRRCPVAPDIAASFLSTSLPARDPNRPCALILAPHPDDECLMGALPLRLQREQGWQTISVAVTLGSNPDRRAGRLHELSKACAVLGFSGVLPCAEGFADVTEATRASDPLVWQDKVAGLSALIAHYQPGAVFLPHAQDANVTHIGTHYLGMDALASQPAAFITTVLQSEYWHPLAIPNLMIGMNEGDVTTLMTALACHAGEIVRNPYDRRFPAYLIDNVRRGSERVGGKGSSTAAMDFASLYQIGLWRAGKYVPSALCRMISAEDSLSELFD